MTGDPIAAIDGDDRHYTLSRLQGWLQMVQAPPRPQPPLLAAAELAGLPQRERLRYDDQRMVWHANLGPIRTPQLLALHDRLAEAVESNRQDGDKVKPGVIVDAYPGLGKTTAVLAFARQFHLDQVALRGETTREGHRRIPVVYVALTANTSMRSLNEAICRFYGLPLGGNADQLAARAADAVLSCGSPLLLIDDIHFLDMRRRDARVMANHLKHLANTFPLTLICIGVGVEERGVLSEGLAPTDAAFAQSARRVTRLTLPPFLVDTQQGRRDWRRLLLAIERQLVLANKHRGMVADDLSDYLYARSTGHFASLMTLVCRGCHRAIRTGQERLSIGLLDQVTNDAAAEAARKELMAALEAGLFTTRPQPQSGRTRKRSA
jgi:hypothetical protein